MRYRELFAVTDLLSDIRKGVIKNTIHANTKIDLASAEDYFKNVLADVDKSKVKSNAAEMIYQLRIEVGK